MSALSKRNKTGAAAQRVAKTVMADEKAALTHTISPVRPGLVIVTLREPALLHLPRAALERESLCGRDKSGLRLLPGKPKRRMVSKN